MSDYYDQTRTTPELEAQPTPESIEWNRLTQERSIVQGQIASARETVVSLSQRSQETASSLQRASAVIKDATSRGARLMHRVDGVASKAEKLNTFVGGATSFISAIGTGVKEITGVETESLTDAVNGINTGTAALGALVDTYNNVRDEGFDHPIHTALHVANFAASIARNVMDREELEVSPIAKMTLDVAMLGLKAAIYATEPKNNKRENRGEYTKDEYKTLLQNANSELQGVINELEDLKNQNRPLEQLHNQNTKALKDTITSLNNQIKEQNDYISKASSHVTGLEAAIGKVERRVMKQTERAMASMHVSSGSAESSRASEWQKPADHKGKKKVKKR